jgi:hypothetical protein
MKTLKDISIEIFEHMVQKTSFRNYEFKLLPQYEKCIDNFLNSITKNININSIGYDYMFDFISFVFSVKVDQKTRLGKGVVYFNHIFSINQYQKFLEANEQQFFYREQFLAKYEINKDILKQFILNPVKKYNKDYIETEKLRSNIDICFENNFSFIFKSLTCLRCKNQEECKTLTKMAVV